MTSTIRWGLLGTGRISREFAEDLALLDDHAIAAVGSRTAESAAAFAAAHGAARAHDSYAGVVSDPGVDVVYVGTPHHRHADDVRLALEAGKPVLCEKPFTLDAATTAGLLDLARERGLFVAEAMWMRTNPVIRAVHERAAAGACGPIRQVRADLGFVGKPEVRRLWDPTLGGSALMDIGVYPLTFALMILGEPDSIAAAGTLAGNGVDTDGGAVLTYASGAVATISWSFRTWSDGRAAISGPGGRVEVPAPMHHPPFATYAHGESLTELRPPVTGLGLAHEAEEVGRCLREGLTESPLLPHAGSLAVARACDEIRAQLGVADLG